MQSQGSEWAQEVEVMSCNCCIQEQGQQKQYSVTRMQVYGGLPQALLSCTLSYHEAAGCSSPWMQQTRLEAVPNKLFECKQLHAAVGETVALDAVVDVVVEAAVVHEHEEML